jgi:hypothetical protein
LAYSKAEDFMATPNMKNDMSLFPQFSRRSRPGYKALSQPTNSFADHAAGFLDGIAAIATFVAIGPDALDAKPATAGTAPAASHAAVPRPMARSRHEFPVPGFA